MATEAESERSPLLSFACGCFSGILEPIHRLASCPGDDELTTIRKHFVVPGNIFTLFVFLIVTFTNIVNGEALFSILGSGSGAVASFAFSAYYIWAKSCSPRAIELNLYAELLFVIFLDYDAVWTRAWALTVLILDVALVCRLPNRVTFNVLVAVSLWLLLYTVEKAIRFGFLDWAYPAETLERRMEMCSCGKPPCARGWANSITASLEGLFVYFMDFYFTRGFAKAVLEEKVKVESAVDVSKRIAQSCAAFDLDDAAMVLEDPAAATLPGELRKAFETILQNLEAYRPFLPDAMFEIQKSSSYISIGHPPPGAASGKAALVFTDIKSSTSAWEQCPEGMKKALKTHNTVVRQCIQEYRGYEVKTIGDAFMVAFDEVSEACLFGLNVQERLHAATWPPSLLELPLCRPDSRNLWNGLRVRIGINWGGVELELNNLTGRFDYMGPTVNKAARVEAAAYGGTIALSSEAREQLDEDTLCDPPPVMEAIGNCPMKGVAGDTSVWLLVPRVLKGRLDATSHDEIVKQRSDIVPMREVVKDRMEHVASATVAVVTMDQVGMNERLTQLLVSADRTEGTVIGVFGSLTACGWNTAKRSAQHFHNALRFLVLFDSSSADSRCGLCTGEVVTGSIGSVLQKFMTVAGPTMVLARKLSDACCDAGIPALAAHPPVVVRPHPREMSYCRPFDAWEQDKDVTMVYEISTSRLRCHSSLASLHHEPEAPPPQQEGWGWTAAYWEAFEAGDAETIWGMADHEENPSEAALLRLVADLLWKKVSLRGSLRVPFPTST